MRNKYHQKSEKVARCGRFFRGGNTYFSLPNGPTPHNKKSGQECAGFGLFTRPIRQSIIRSKKGKKAGRSVVAKSLYDAWFSRHRPAGLALWNMKQIPGTIVIALAGVDSRRHQYCRMRDDMATL